VDPSEVAGTPLPVLNELRVENLLLIERAELRLAPGLNVLTGETGAGKTVLAHALDLLLGGRPRAGIVRPGAAEAYVEGVFELPEALHAELGERLPQDADEVVLARRVNSNGRTRAYINGRSASVGDLRDLAGVLVSFYGQHEHRRLTLVSAQLDLLDAFCGPEHAARREEHAKAHEALRKAEAELEELRIREGARERELDLLEFELSEIEEAAPSESETAELREERERLRHAETLRAAALGGADALDPDGDGVGVVGLLAQAAAGLDGVAGVDAQLDALAARLQSLQHEADDLARELRRAEERIEATPGRLEEIESRLAVLERLERKHGGSIAEVLAYAERARARRDELAGVEQALEDAEAARDRAREEAQRLAGELHATRAEAAPKLAAAVRERLDELSMAGATFEIAITEREPGPTGTDAVEFLLASNPGVPPAPVREVASGGELSRVMLALLSVAHEVGAGVTRAGGRDETGGPAGPESMPLLVFDEIDAGIGGQTARAVGERLKGLSATHQVLCITHLPQIASMADRHFRIEKDPRVEPALTTVTQLDAGAVVGELARMLGADEEDRTARRHAKELLKAA
jgi:DNA repair protein RecN (Recombination protein N)